MLDETYDQYSPEQKAADLRMQSMYQAVSVRNPGETVDQLIENAKKIEAYLKGSAE